MAVSTAGLSRAYAVLRQLEKLRETEITDPLLPLLPQPSRRPVQMTVRHRSSPPRDSYPSSAISAPTETQPVSPSTSPSSASTPFDTAGNDDRSIHSHVRDRKQDSRHTPARSSTSAGPMVIAYVEKIPDDASSEPGSEARTGAAAGGDAPDERPRHSPGGRHRQQHCGRSDWRDRSCPNYNNSDPITLNDPHAVSTHEAPSNSHHRQNQQPGQRRELLFRRRSSSSSSSRSSAPPAPLMSAASVPLVPSVVRPSVWPGRSPRAHRDPHPSPPPTTTSEEHAVMPRFDPDAAREAALVAASGSLRQLSLPYREEAYGSGSGSGSGREEGERTTTPSFVNAAGMPRERTLKRTAQRRSRSQHQQPQSTLTPTATAAAGGRTRPRALPSTTASSASASVADVESFIDSDDGREGEKRDGVEEPRGPLTASRHSAKASAMRPVAEVSTAAVTAAAKTPPPLTPNPSLPDSQSDADSSILVHYRGAGASALATGTAGTGSRQQLHIGSSSSDRNALWGAEMRKNGPPQIPHQQQPTSTRGRPLISAITPPRSQTTANNDRVGAQSPPPRMQPPPPATATANSLHATTSRHSPRRCTSPSERGREVTSPRATTPTTTITNNIRDDGSGTHYRRSSPSRRGRRSSPPPPAVPSTLHFPLLAYIEELSRADSTTLTRELASTRGSCADPASPDAFSDCLALTVLANIRSVVRRVIVPLLMEVLLRSSATPSEHSLSTTPDIAEGSDTGVFTIPRWARQCGDAGDTAGQALCALIGLGDAAAETLPVLVEMLTNGEGPDPRLTAMAIRCVGGPAGLRELQRLATAKTVATAKSSWQAADVQCAALYGLGVMPYSVLGHTTVLCVCEGEESFDSETTAGSIGKSERAPKWGRSVTSLRDGLSFYEEPTPDGPYVEMCAVDTSSGSGRVVAWRRLDSRTTPAALHSSLQARPPYRPVHVRLRPAALHERLSVFVLSEAFRPARSYPHLVLVLRDWFLFYEEQRTTRFARPILNSLRAAEHELGAFLGTVEESLADPTSVTMPLVLLPYAYDGGLARSPALIFDVERVVLCALVDSPSPAVKAQALATIGSLPPAARPHAGQPVVDFAMAFARQFEERWGLSPRSGDDRAMQEGGGVRRTATAFSPLSTTKTSATPSKTTATDPEGLSTRAAMRRNAQEAAEEAALVAAAVVVGYAAVANTAGFAGAALEHQARHFLLDLLRRSSQSGSRRWRIRHAACVGLGALGAGTLLYTQRERSHDSRMNNTGGRTEGTSWPLPVECASFGITREEGPAATPRAPQGTGTAAAVAVVDALMGQLKGALSAPETVCWAMVRQGPIGVRRTLSLLADATVTPEAHLAAAHALAQVCIHAAAAAERESANVVVGSSTRATGEEDALVDDLIVRLTHAIVSPGVLDEEAVVACVNTLAVVVDQCDTRRGRNRRALSASPPSKTKPRGVSIGASRLVGDDNADPRYDEAATYCEGQEPSDCFLVLRSVVESAPLPYAVLQALFATLCAYGGCHGELYACQTIIKSPAVKARAAAAYGLRACGPKVARAIALALSDDAVEVRREGFATLEAVGIHNVAAAVCSPRRPVEHREQILDALRDCLLRDLGRGERRTAAQELYDTLTATTGNAAIRSL